MPIVPVALSLGSNLGDRRAHLEWAVGQLRTLLTGLQVSEVIETEAVEVPEPQASYLNMAVVGESELPATALVDVLLGLERQRGRTRLFPRAPRTLDLDLVFYGSDVINTAGVVVPHPRFRERRFVLEPLAALMPRWVDPVTGRTVAELLARLDQEHNGA